MPRLTCLMRRVGFAAATMIACGPLAPAAEIGTADLDPATFAQWVDGKETPVSSEQAKDGPAAVVMIDGKPPKNPYGIRFGGGTASGPRHLRIGFTKSTPVGSVLVAAGGRLGVLKPEAAYPGDLADDTQWIPAERLTA